MIISKRTLPALLQDFKILFLIILFGCSMPFINRQKEIARIYSCEVADMLFYESDSTQIYIYNPFYGSPFYEDTTTLMALKKGILQPIHIYKAMHLVQKERANTGKWIEETIVYPQMLRYKSDDCFKEIPDSNSTVIEIIKTYYEDHNEDGDIFSFEITFSYGTDHACFDMQIIDEKKIRIRHTGWIL